MLNDANVQRRRNSQQTVSMENEPQLVPTDPLDEASKQQKLDAMLAITIAILQKSCPNEIDTRFVLGIQKATMAP